MTWTKYQKPIEHECKFPGYFTILFHGGFWENAQVWKCKQCLKSWRPKKLVLTGDYTFVEIKIKEKE